MTLFFRVAFVLFSVGMFTACSSDESSLPLEPVVTAYDTLEYRYQQISDLAIDLMANISMDPSIRVKQVQDLLDREPVVSLDFRKTTSTQRDISKFISYQHAIDKGLRSIFTQLEQAPKWREAPLIIGIKNRYTLLNDSIAIAADVFNVASKAADLKLQIPADSTDLH